MESSWKKLIGDESVACFWTLICYDLSGKPGPNAQDTTPTRDLEHYEVVLFGVDTPSPARRFWVSVDSDTSKCSELLI